MTTFLHGNGAYFYDLGCQGWFGNPTFPNVSSSLWAGISSAVSPFFSILGSAESKLSELRSDNTADVIVQASTPSLHAEIAIFVDDQSAATWISLLDGGTSTDLVQLPPIFISASGAPARVFLMSDLLSDTADWSAFKFCVLLNPFVISADVADAISHKLQTNGRTLAWTHAPGIFPAVNSSREVDVDRMSQLVGIPLARGDGSHFLMTHVNKSATLSSGFPRNYGSPIQSYDPWFYADYNLSRPLPKGVEVRSTTLLSGRKIVFRCLRFGRY